MAFPTIPTVAAGRVLTALQADTTATRTFPSLTGLTKNSGDLLLAIVVSYQGAGAGGAGWSGWTAGWTELLDFASTTVMSVGVAYKWSTGAETGAITVTQAATVTGHAAMILMSIPGAHATSPPEHGNTANTGTTAAADPTNHTPSWGADDTLWITYAGSGETATTGSFTGVATAPTNYANTVLTGITADVVGGMDAAVAFRQLNAASENVGVWALDLSQTRNVAGLIAVRPAPPAPVSENAPTGGATGLGTPPAPKTPLAIDGAVGQGTTPSPKATVPVGASVGLGTAPAPRTAVSIGAAVGQATAPGVSVLVTPGGAVGGGTAPAAPVFESVAIGGATGLGTAPVAQVTATVGASVAQGTGPGARTTTAPGASVGQGTSPGARTVVGQFGAVGQGTAPGVRASVVPAASIGAGATPSSATPIGVGASVAAGTGAGVRVSIGTGGGAIGSGKPPSEPGAAVTDPVTPGGALGQGTISGLVQISITPGSALAFGTAPTENIIIPSSGIPGNRYGQTVGHRTPGVPGHLEPTSPGGR